MWFKKKNQIVAFCVDSKETSKFGESFISVVTTPH